MKSNNPVISGRILYTLENDDDDYDDVHFDDDERKFKIFIGILKYSSNYLIENYLKYQLKKLSAIKWLERFEA